MAHGNHDSLPARRSPRKMDEGKNGNGQLRRLELEQEVAMLQKKLENEEKVNDVLEQAMMSGTTGSSLHIPSFLPKEVKELLAELVMVEEEIARLEEELKKNKQGLRDSHEGCDQVTHKSTQKEQEIISTIKSLKQTQGYSTPSPEGKTTEQKLAPETGTLFFINQAIKGDYTIHNFTHKENINGLVENKNVKERQRVLNHQESHPRKSEIIDKPRKSATMEKSFSPRLHQVHPMPGQPKTNLEFSSNLGREPSIANSLKENHQKWQPNKLSEKIMKCLICIFLRLIRTSRATELEKSGSLLRTINPLLRPGNFRADVSLNLKANFNTQREKLQQDPYGIFEIEDSLVRDIGPYKNLVRFTSSHLESKRISSALPLLNKLRVLLKALHEVDIIFLTHQQKLAFWINMYNTCIMHGFLEHGIPSNPQKVVALRNKVVLNIGGKILSALEIEQFILRQSSNIMEASWKGDNNVKAEAVRNIYGLEHSDPNVPFALCCGNKSSPVLKVYTTDSISTELEKSKVEYLQASIVVIASKRLMIPKLLHLHMHDFAEDLSSLLDWICQQLPTSGSLRKCITEFLKGKTNEKISDIVDILPYDFDFQYLLPM